jgi:predicted RNase H-like nuclease (RuvC/YqgF family)
MTEGEMKKVSAWIPQDTLTKLEEKGYQNRAEAIRLGLECLLRESGKEDTGNPMESNEEDIRNPMESSEEDIRNPMESNEEDIRNPMESNNVTNGILQARVEDLEKHNETLKTEISRLKNVIMEAPDPIELAKLQERNEGLNLLINEKEKRIEDLTKYKEDIGVFANYFKSNPVKQIEAPAAEKVRPWWRFW